MLELVDVNKSYAAVPEDVQILRDVNLSIEPGQSVSIMGPSGSGKTTLLNLMGGLDRPSSGKVMLNRTNLRSLRIDHTSITDEGLKHLGGLSTLEVLKLSGCPITDDGLGHLAGLGELWMLHLDHTAITDEGLIHLSGLAKLRTLDLRGTSVTDDGLRHLHDHWRLETLFVEGTDVSEKGVAEINRILLNRPAIP